MLYTSLRDVTADKGGLLYTEEFLASNWLIGPGQVSPDPEFSETLLMLIWRIRRRLLEQHVKIRWNLPLLLSVAANNPSIRSANSSLHFKRVHRRSISTARRQRLM